MNPPSDTTNKFTLCHSGGPRRRAVCNPALGNGNFPRRLAMTNCRICMRQGVHGMKNAARRGRFQKDKTIYRCPLWPPPPPEPPWELGALAPPPPWYPPPPELGGAAARLG